MRGWLCIYSDVTPDNVSVEGSKRGSKATYLPTMHAWGHNRILSHRPSLQRLPTFSSNLSNLDARLFDNACGAMRTLSRCRTVVSSIILTNLHLRGILQRVGPFLLRFIDACSRRANPLTNKACSSGLGNEFLAAPINGCLVTLSFILKSAIIGLRQPRSTCSRRLNVDLHPQHVAFGVRAAKRRPLCGIAELAEGRF